MKYSKEERYIAQILYDKMKSLPIGTEISVSELSLLALEEHQIEDGFPMFDLWNVMNALRYMMNTERKLRMDFTKHELLCEGLPFNIPFVLLKWGQRIYTKEVRIARSFAKSNNLYTPIRDKIAISCMLRQIHEFSSHAIRHGLYIKNRKRLFCP